MVEKALACKHAGYVNRGIALELGNPKEMFLTVTTGNDCEFTNDQSFLHNMAVSLD